MNKLIEIKGFWKTRRKEDYNDKNMWEGKLLLEEDGWFEGIVIDPESQYKGNRFIFGIYHENKIIELLKISPENVSNPFVFRCQKNRKEYEGIFSVIDTYDEYPCGESKIITNEIDYLKEKQNIETEKERLLNKINSFKEENDYKELYENILNIRSNLSEYVLRKYKGDKFTKKEIEEYLEPNNEKDAKKLVK